jgi:hypothetical protein
MIYKYAEETSCVHNLLLRGLNTAYNQCLGVQPGKDAEDFLFFNQLLWEQIHDHHDSEEEYFFPAVENIDPKNKGLMKTNSDEHAQFHESLEAYGTYVHSCKSADYDGQKLQNLIKACGDPITEHLHNEIGTLLQLYGSDEAKLGEVWSGLGKRVFAKLDNFRHLPLLIGCGDSTFQLDGQVRPFPPVPFFMPYLVRYVFGRRHARSLRFCPSDEFGRPRKLKFAA